MEPMTVDVRVGAILKEFIVSTTGTDLLVPEKDTVLWAMLKLHLVTSPAAYKPVKDRTEYVSISLRSSRDAKTLNLETGQKLSVNTLFRCFLTPKGENIIKLHLEKEFKKTFRDYMKGSLDNNPDISIKDAISEFCASHKLSLSKITLDMLYKDWYRYRVKNRLNNICPLIF